MQASTTAALVMAEDFLGWWSRQMRTLAFGWRRRAAVSPDAVIIDVRHFEEDPQAASGAITLRRAGQETTTATLDLSRPLAAPPAGLPCGLRLPAGLVLRREVVLPLAAERDLSAALGYEMDRLTPFDAHELFWGIVARQRDPARGLRLTLVIAPRRPVEQLLAALRQRDLRPTFLETDAGRIEIAHTPAGASGRAGRTALPALYALCGLLALACLAIPVVRQQLALAAAARGIAALAPVQREAARLHGRLAIAAAGQAAVAAARRGGDALSTLAALTTALPDGTSLSDLTLKSGDLTIDGQSSNAAALIAALAAARLSDPKFVAPVTRAIDGAADLFSIHATVAP